MAKIERDRSHACRCRYCGRRARLSLHPARFVRVPRCGCRGERKAIKQADEAGAQRPQTWRVDKYRDDGREARGKTCKCLGYSFPHRRGSGWCDHNPNWTAEDAEKRAAWA